MIFERSLIEKMMRRRWVYLFVVATENDLEFSNPIQLDKVFLSRLSSSSLVKGPTFQILKTSVIDRDLK